MPQAADVGGGAAHVDDERLVALGEKRGAAHRVGRPRREGVDGIRLRHLRQHDGPVVLGEVEGRAIPLAPRARLNARVVVRASSMRQALSRAAFSRSSRPMRPSRWERVTATSGHSSRTMAAASSSQEAFSGENTAEIATERIPASRNRRAAARMPPVSNGTSGRPSNSWPPSSITISPRTRVARSSGQSTNGGREAPEGRPMRTAATRPRSRRCTTALVKWVVPIMAAWASRAAGACRRARRGRA